MYVRANVLEISQINVRAFFSISFTCFNCLKAKLLTKRIANDMYPLLRIDF